jgi:hypothetical protein
MPISVDASRRARAATDGPVDFACGGRALDRRAKVRAQPVAMARSHRALALVACYQLGRRCSSG